MAIQNLGDAVVSITGDNTQFNSSIDKSKAKFKSLSQSIAESTQSLARSFKNIDGEATVWGNSVDLIKKKQEALKTEITNLISQGVDPLDRSIEKLQKEYYKLGNEAIALQAKQKTLKQKLNESSEAAIKIGRSMSMYVSLPLAAMGAVAIKTGADFETAMNKVRAITGATGEVFSKLEKQARDLGASTQFTASEAANAMSFLAMAGFDVNKIYDVMPDTLNLAAAAQLDMGSAADIVTNIMAGFGLESTDLANSVDVLTKAFTSSNTDLRQLGEAMKYAGPVAKSVGLSVADAAAAIGVLSNAGIQGSMAGTSLKRVLSTLITENKKLGISVTDSEGKLIPFVDMIAQLEEKGLTAAESMQIFGERGGPGIQVLLEAGSEKIRQLTDNLNSAGGTADRIAKIQMEGLNGTLKILKSVSQESAISLSKILIPSIQNMAKGLISGISNFNKLDEATKKNTLTIIGAVAALGPLIAIVGAATKAIINFNAAMILNPIVLITTAIVALAAGVLIFSNNTKKAQEEYAKFKKVAGGGTIGTAADDLKVLNSELENLKAQLSSSTGLWPEQDKALQEQINRIEELVKAKRKQALADAASAEMNRRGVAAGASTVSTLKEETKATEEKTEADEKVLEFIKTRTKLEDTYKNKTTEINRLVELGMKNESEADEEKLSALNDEINGLNELYQTDVGNAPITLKLLKEKIALYVELKNKIESAKEELKSEADEIENTKKKWDELKDKGNDTYKSRLEEIEKQKKAFITAGIDEVDAEKWATSEKKKLWLEYTNYAITQISQLASQFSSIYNQDLQNQLDAIDAKKEAALDALDKQMEAELEAAGVADETAVESAEAALEAAKEEGDAEEILAAEKALKKAQIEEDYANKKEQIEKEAAMASYKVELAQFKTNKALNIAQALIAGAQAALQALKLGPIAGPIAAAVMAGLTAYQIKVIREQQAPTAPTFAEGGVVLPTNGGTTAIVGEGGQPEVIFPLDKLESFLSSYSNNSNSLSNSEPINLTITLDSRTLYSGIFNASKNRTILIDAGAII